MQNLNETYQIRFWKLKTFNEKLNASIGFLKNFWKPLLRANLAIAGPLFILGVGIILFYFNVLLQNLVLESTSDFGTIFLSLFFYIFLGGILYGFSFLTVILVTFEVIHLQQHDIKNMNNLSLIFKNIRKKFWKLAGVMFLLVAIFFVGYMIVGMISIPLTFLGVFGALLMFPMQIALYLVIYSFSYVLLPMAYFEKNSLSVIIRKAKHFLEGNFWQTSGMYLGSKAIQYVIANGILIPIIISIYFYIISRVDLYAERFDSINENKLLFSLGMILLFLYLLFNLATNIFHVITSVVQYMSLKEQKESTYIFQQIENFELISGDAEK